MMLVYGLVMYKTLQPIGYMAQIQTHLQNCHSKVSYTIHLVTNSQLLRKTDMSKPKRLLPQFEDLEAHIQDDDYSGWCTHCGDWTHDSCEPDAHEYECPVCENPTCYGAEELLITFMGM